MEMIIIIKLSPPYHHQQYHQDHFHQYHPHHHHHHQHHHAANAQIGQALVGMDREESGPVLTPEEEECLRWKNNFHQHQFFFIYVFRIVIKVYAFSTMFDPPQGKKVVVFFTLLHLHILDGHLLRSYCAGSCFPLL